MTPAQATAMYRRLIGPFQIISIRKYHGTGANRPRFDWDVQARVMDFDADQLVGPIAQGDRKLIVLHEDLENAGFPFPIETGQNWKAVVEGRELQIKSVDADTRKLGNTVIAYNIAAGG